MLLKIIVFFLSLSRCTESKVFESPGDCELVVDGIPHTSLMFADPGAEVSVDVAGDCSTSEVRVVAVGGGGYGSYGGGGSGLIQYQTKGLAGVTNIRLTVGDHAEPSSVIINDQRIVAKPGFDGILEHGGYGYSGGSGWCLDVRPCRGGSDGGDGDDVGSYSGGHGSSVDISNYKLDHWVLTPGAGGDGTVQGRCVSGDHEGAGAGGVLVNGYGPDHYVQDGEGYGGGGGFCGGESGHQGVILLEIVQ